MRVELFGLVFEVGLIWEEVVVWSVLVFRKTMRMEVLFEVGVVFGLKVEE